MVHQELLQYWLSYHIFVEERNKFEWTAECATKFDQLKNLHTNAPVSKIADHDKEFVVCIDACKEGLGGVLMQEG